ncbi:helix-turn-helix domain-containing protein [Microbacteriaceae bacterium VKM Ac-2854]|nr:helix-turn-helix domain-containing protein [Microbacteriaceae bacterium VKM Ac-2854]
MRRGTVAPSAPAEPFADAVALGRRIRAIRKQRGMTLDALAEAIGRAPSQVSVIENGKREPRLSMVQTIARALDVSAEELFAGSPASHREALEVRLARAQRGPLYGSLGLPALRVGPSLSTEAIETILRLHDELERVHTERAATPEEARRANIELRALMRARGNYFPEIERVANDLLAAVGHRGGPLTQRDTADLADHLGFSLHYVTDLPHSTRSVLDRSHGRVYLPQRIRSGGDPRSAVLQSLANHILGHREPGDYAEFLRQRVEANYLAAALLLPEPDAVRMLDEAKQYRRLSIEDLRDAFAVSYETAAHRFTNLATRHLGIPVHFMKVHESGVVTKAYENDDVCFPTDALGAIEGQRVCRNWTARTVFAVDDRFNPFYQYTDTPTGTYWCTSRVRPTDDGEFSVSVGVPFAEVRWFRGRDTPHRAVSRCPDAACCSSAPDELRRRWAQAWPTARPHASVLTALPQGPFPGVDTTEVYAFLEAHAPTPREPRTSD